MAQGQRRRGMWITVAVLALGLSLQARAETITCEGRDSHTGLTVTVQAAPVRPVGVPVSYLSARAKLGDQWIAPYADLGLYRTRDGLTYRDRMTPQSFTLVLSTLVLPGLDEGATLVLYKGLPYEARYTGLACRIEGDLMYPLRPCPTGAAAQSQDLLRQAQAGNLRDLENALGCGADASFRDRRGCSALHYVTDTSCARPEAVSHRGRGPLVEDGLIRLLGASGADLNLPDSRGSTAFINAARNGEVESAIALLELGADVNRQDRTRSSALMYAAIRGDELLIRVLLDANPDLAMRNSAGKTARDLALEYGHGDVAAVLIPRAARHVINGNADGSCSPTMVHLMRGQDAEIVLESKTNRMFLLESPRLGLELMAMPNDRDAKVIRPSETGTFPFTCGVHGAPERQQTRGSFMVM